MGGPIKISKTVLSSSIYGLAVTKAVSYIILDTDDYRQIFCDTTSGDITITLPLKSNNLNRIIQISHIKGTNKVIINPHATDASKLSNDGLNVIWLPKIGNYVVFQENATSGFWEIVCERIASQLRLDGYAGYGSTDTRIMRFTTLTEFYGNLFSENHSTGYSSNAKGLEITINRSGRYSLDISGSSAAGAAAGPGLSVNSNQLTTAIYSITTANFLGWLDMPAGGYRGLLSSTRYFSKNDIIRLHADGVAPDSPTTSFISIVYLG